MLFAAALTSASQAGVGAPASGRWLGAMNIAATPAMICCLSPSPVPVCGLPSGVLRRGVLGAKSGKHRQSRRSADRSRPARPRPLALLYRPSAFFPTTAFDKSASSCFDLGLQHPPRAPLFRQLLDLRAVIGCLGLTGAGTIESHRCRDGHDVSSAGAALASSVFCLGRRFVVSHRAVAVSPTSSTRLRLCDLLAVCLAVLSSAAPHRLSASSVFPALCRRSFGCLAVLAFAGACLSSLWRNLAFLLRWRRLGRRRRVLNQAFERGWRTVGRRRTCDARHMQVRRMNFGI